MAKKNGNKSFKVELLQLCDYALISKENKLSIIGIFDRILVSSIPSNHPQLFVVSLISGKPHDGYSINLDILTPAGSNVLPTQKLNGQLGSNGNSNLIAGIGNLQFTQLGSYSIQLSTTEGVLATKTFEVLSSGGADGGGGQVPRYSN